jgi:catechol 2,3-dioxygenase-like lactoylglutathione lyase family enzyme
MVATILRVRHVEESVAWYKKVFGIEPLHVGADGPLHPYAAFDMAGSIVSLWQLPPGVTRERSENDRNTYLVFATDEDPETFREELIGMGVNADPIRESENHRFFWFYDLDGNRFEIATTKASVRS